MRRLLLLLALLFAVICHRDAEAQNVQTFYLKGFPIGQPKVNVLPRDASKIRVMRRGYALDAAGNPTTALSGVFSDSMSVGVYDGIVQDSIPDNSIGGTWRSPWVPIYGAKQAIFHFAHADTDSIINFVVGVADTVNPTGALTAITSSWGPNGPNGYNVGWQTKTDFATATANGFRRALSVADGDNSIAILVPSRDGDSDPLPMFTSRFVQLRITPRDRPQSATGHPNSGHLTGMRVWCEVIYPSSIPYDPIYEYYKGAAIQ